MIHILAAETSPLASQLLADALRRSRIPKFQVSIPSSLTPDGCFEEIARTRPDVAVLALNLRNEPLSALEVIRDLHSQGTDTKCVVLLEQSDRNLVEATCPEQDVAQHEDAPRFRSTSISHATFWPPD